MNFNRILLAALLLSLPALSGCGLIRAFIDTQPAVKFQETAYAKPEDIVHGPVILYDFSDAELTGMNAREAELLRRFAPVIAQGQPTRAADAAADSLGMPGLRRTHAGYAVTMDAARPALFARVEHARVHGATLPQLVYMFWYPCRPEGGVQEGEVDGGVLRITLDAADRPTIYEYAQSCGCYHGVFVAEHVEQWAAAEFGDKEGKLRYFVETRVPRRAAWEVRDLVRHAADGARPVLFLESGLHVLDALQTADVMAGWPSHETRAYTLLPYDRLSQLPVADEAETGSMFNEDGRVWGAKRGGEELLFSDLDHAGWPRHLDCMKIHWDDAAWNDPTLLMTFLRLPKCVADPRAALPTTVPRH